MDVLIFSDNKSLFKKFAAPAQSKINLEIYAVDEVKKLLKKRNDVSLIYLDVSDMEEDEIKKQLKYLSNLKSIRFGVIDAKGAIDDVAAVFHAGGVDLLRKNNLGEGFNPKRLKLIEEYVANYRRDIDSQAVFSSQKESAADYIIQENGWAGIKEGREYSFFMLFVELDNVEEIARNYNKKNLEKALPVFRNYIEKNIGPYEGKFLFWNGFGGLILFPFYGKESQACMAAFKIMLYKFLHDVEESYFPHVISFRMALHLGNLVYDTHNTGEIVADSINFIFHLARKAVPPGHFYLTDETLPYVPSPFKAFIKTQGEFEGRSVFRVKRPGFLLS